MIKVAYEIVKDFGALGVGIVQLGVIIVLFWKLFTNHLRHLGSKIDDNIRETKGVKKEVTNLKERISKVEGKLS